jgi:TATA-box binding protein (TBP) (component of TFIID and TFIIIB)
MAPMWGFWWIFPVIGLLIFLLCVALVARMIFAGGHLMCSGARRENDEETARLRREVDALREQVKKLANTR